MTLQKLTLFHCLLLILLLASCASQKGHLFGVQKDTPLSEVAVIDWGRTHTSLLNGVFVKKIGRKTREFSTDRNICIPPGDYMIYVGALGVVSKRTEGSTTRINTALHEIPLTAKPGMKYTLERVGSGMSEKISVRETALDRL